MKQLASIIAISIFSIGSIFAQENRDVQETTTVKKVTMRNDAKVTTQVIEETDADMEVVKVEGSDALNQDATIVKQNMDTKKKVMDSNSDNTANKDLVAKKQALRKKEMEASKRAEMEKAAKEKMIMEQNKAKMQADLEARRAALQSRPKGMKKLKKKNN